MRSHVGNPASFHHLIWERFYIELFGCGSVSSSLVAEIGQEERVIIKKRFHI